MKLHKSVTERITALCIQYAGFDKEKKLKQEIELLELSIYQQKKQPFNEILVLTKDLMNNY